MSICIAKFESEGPFSSIVGSAWIVLLFNSTRFSAVLMFVTAKISGVNPVQRLGAHNEWIDRINASTFGIIWGIYGPQRSCFGVGF